MSSRATSEEAIAVFLGDPESCLPLGYDWKMARDLLFSFNGHQIVHVEGINPLIDGGQIVGINRFCVDGDLLRRGAGRRAVEYLAQQFQTYFPGVLALKFEQRDDTSYPAFYQSIGAHPVPGPLTNKTGWNSWVWPILQK